MGRPVPVLDEAAMDPAHMLAAMRALNHEVPITRLGVRTVTVEPLERRLLRYHLELDAPRPDWSVVGKVYESHLAGQHAFDLMRRLWDSGFAARPPASVRIPQPYCYLADLRLLLMEDVPGKSLKALVRRKAAGPDEVGLLALALAKLHTRAVATGPRFGVDDHLTIRCDGRHDALAQAFPRIAPLVHLLIDRARALEAQLAPAPAAVHGDFHFGQVHVRKGEAWILDLDPLHVGDPAYDVAMVFVTLKQLERRLNDQGYVRMLRDAFITAYFAGGGFEIAQRVPLHIALIHLKRACKRFRYKDEDGWPYTVCRQIEEGAACMRLMDAVDIPRAIWDIGDIYDDCPVTV